MVLFQRTLKLFGTELNVFSPFNMYVYSHCILYGGHYSDANTLGIILYSFIQYI